MPHQRRKSGDNRRVVGASDLKLSRTSTPRRFTPASSTSSSSQKLNKMSSSRQSYDSDEESFPQFCMTCEKQFVAHDEKFVYCSEACRRSDQSSSSSASSSSTAFNHYGSYSDSADMHLHEPIRDIIPQASPSRPTSTLFASSPSDEDYYPSHRSYHESAVDALRSSLSSMAVRPPSPSSPTSGSIWPFRRASAAPSISSNEGSYHKPSYMTSATYDAGYYHRYGNQERPLPTRTPYSRPKSIELVTPILTR